MKCGKLFKLLLLATLLPQLACNFLKQEKTEEGSARLAMFVGMDISGSFIRGGYFDDSIRFLSHYLYAHLKGLGGLEVPKTLFVGSIGGARADEAKTLFPIQTFENKSVDAIERTLRDIFPKKRENPFTDFNAFFKQVTLTARNKNLVLRPIEVVMISDGLPDVSETVRDFKGIDVKAMENLSRSVTLRLLYTNAEVGKGWQTKVKRRRVKIWTQDAKVMVAWNDPNLLTPGREISKQTQFFEWILDNVDFNVRSKIVH